MSNVLRPGLATSIGSVPHEDPAEATAFVLAHHADLPAAPQLPQRSPVEGMVAQWARGIQGVTVVDDGRLVVDVDALDADAAVDTATDHDALLGIRTFLQAVAGRQRPVKLQLTGPVTLGCALVHAGAPAAAAFPVAMAAVRAHARALLGLARASVPDAPLVVFLDEPGLTRVVRPDFPLGHDETIDVLSGGLAALEADAVTGVHCCGWTDWRLVAQAGPRILSMPADAGVLRVAGAVSAFLENGGWVAWGAVPTHEPLGDDVDRLWRRLTALWCELVQVGCDPVQLRARAIVTPECGLAGHGPSQASRTLRLAAELAGRAQDQAAAARLSVGV